jgi:hypothetical protein
MRCLTLRACARTRSAHCLKPPASHRLGRARGHALNCPRPAYPLPLPVGSALEPLSHSRGRAVHRGTTIKGGVILGVRPVRRGVITIDRRGARRVTMRCLLRGTVGWQQQQHCCSSHPSHWLTRQSVTTVASATTQDRDVQTDSTPRYTAAAHRAVHHRTYVMTASCPTMRDRAALAATDQCQHQHQSHHQAGRAIRWSIPTASQVGTRQPTQATATTASISSTCQRGGPSVARACHRMRLSRSKIK